MMAAVQENALEMICLPCPGLPIRLPAGTATSWKWTRGVTTPRWPSLS